MKVSSLREFSGRNLTGTSDGDDVRMIATSPALRRRTPRARAAMVGAIIACVLLPLTVTSRNATAGDVIQLDPAPELSVGSTTGDGVTLSVSDLRQEEVGSGYFIREQIGRGKVYQIVRVTLTNRSNKTYYPSPLDFRMLDTNANTYKWFPVHRSADATFLNAKEVLEPGESASDNLSFPMPRSKVPAAIEWGTPSLIGEHASLGHTIGTRIVLIPDETGHAVSSVKPAGPIGVASQLGVTVHLKKPQVVDLPPAAENRIPPGFIVETIAGSMENHTSGTVQVHTADFVPLDSHALPFAYPLKTNPLAMDVLYVKPGKTLSGNLTYIVRADDQLVAIRWDPASFIGLEAPAEKIIMLPR